MGYILCDIAPAMEDSEASALCFLPRKGTVAGTAVERRAEAFVRLVTALRASEVHLNGWLGRKHNRHADTIARPARPVIEGPGQAGAEW